MIPITILAVRRIEVFQKIPILAVVVLVISYGVITWIAVAFASEAWHYLLLFVAYWILLTPFLSSGISDGYYIAPFSLRTAMFTHRVEKRYFEDAHKIQLKENKNDFEITFSYEFHSRTLRFENKKKEKVLRFLEGYPITDI